MPVLQANGTEGGPGGLEYGRPLPILEVKEAGEEWWVEGYPSTFGNVDLGDGFRRDTVLPGAFAKTLKSGPKVRFLLSHDPRLVLGVPKRLKEDSKGLFGRLKISQTQLGADTRQLLLDGALDSFSIGYRAIKWEMEAEDIRILKEIELYEISLVPVPMNPEALVTGVKQYLTLADRTRQLQAEVADLLNDLRGLAEQPDHPLSETKRQEIAALLETFSGLDAVRSDLHTILANAQARRLVGPRLTAYQLAQARQRLASKHIIKE